MLLAGIASKTYFLISVNLLLGNFLTVLGGKNNCFHMKRFAVFIMLYGNLGLSKTRIRVVSLCQFVSKEIA